MTITQRDSATIVLAVTAAYTIGTLGGNTQPLTVGALIDGLHFSKASAGLLASIELGAVAACSLALAPRMGRIAHRELINVGALLAALGYIASAVPSSFDGLAVCRIVTGVGAGMVLAIGNASAAACRNPQRVFALMTFFSTLAIAIALEILPTPIGWYSYRGGYAAIGLITLGFTPALIWIPNVVASAHDRVADAIPDVGLGVATMISNALFVFNQTATWAFTEQIALRVDLGHEQIGFVLSGATLSGLIGAGLATRIGIRHGRTLPLIIGVTANGLCILAVVFSRSMAGFAIPLVVANVAYFGVVPYALATAASLDREGRWVAATLGAATIGAALGPGIGGSVVDSLGFGTLGWMVLITTIISAAAITPVALTLDQRDRESSPGGDISSAGPPTATVGASPR